jgi:hypothetical protein
MDIEVGNTGRLKFDSGESRVEVVAIDNGMLGDDVWFNYLEEETHRPLIHENYDVLPKDIIKAPIVIPRSMLDMHNDALFVKD